MSYAFDPNQPSARRLVELARQLKRDDQPTRVKITALLLMAEDDRPLYRGDLVVLPAGVARRLLDDGLARPAA